MRASEKNFAFGWGFTSVLTILFLITEKLELRPPTLGPALVWYAIILIVSFLAGEFFKGWHVRREENFVFNKRVEWYLSLENRVLGREVQTREIPLTGRAEASRFGNYTFSGRPHLDSDPFARAV